MNNKTRKLEIGDSHAQMKIQQMTFMIMAVFLLFIFVALFFINFQFRDIKSSANDLAREEAISSLSVIADMPEFNCDSAIQNCIDEDKLLIMSSDFSRVYDSFWPVSSIKVYKVYPSFDSEIRCPGVGCNYFEVFENTRGNVEEVSTYVNLCKKLKRNNHVFDNCEIAKLVVGVKLANE